MTRHGERACVHEGVVADVEVLQHGGGYGVRGRE